MQTIIVDMTPGFRMPTIYYSQGDVGTQFAVDLRSRFGDSLPAGATVTIQATKPSGFGFSEAATSVTNGVAVFTTVAGMTDEAGRFAAELKVEASGITLFTANFYMNGEASTHPEGTIDGSEETVIPELTQLVERAEEAASSVLDRQTVTNTLPAGSQASYTFDEETNTQTFGIPQGEAGAGAAGVTASAYSSSSTYAVGDYVIHNSNLYRCTTAITTAESFTAAHWTQVVLGDDVSDLKSDLSAVNDDLLIADEILRNPNYKGQTYLERNGVETFDGDFDVTEFIPVTYNQYITINHGSLERKAYIVIYDSSKNVLGDWAIGTDPAVTSRTITVSVNDVAYLRFSFKNGYGGSIVESGVTIWSASDGDGLVYDVNKIEEKTTALIPNEYFSAPFNGFTFIEGQYDSNGSMSSNAGYNTYQFIAPETFQCYFSDYSSLQYVSITAYINGSISYANNRGRLRYVNGGDNTLPNISNKYTINQGDLVNISVHVNNSSLPIFWTNSFRFGFKINDVIPLTNAMRNEIGRVMQGQLIAKYTSGSGYESSTERVSIYIPTIVGYVEYNFVHSVNNSINADVWRLSNTFACDNNLNHRFQLTTNGEWECAVRLDNRSDFCGGIMHGNEVYSSLTILVNGEPISLSDISTATVCDEIRFVEASTLYDNADSSVSIATHTSEHIFSKDGVKINQYLKWLINETTWSCFLAMFPVSNAVTDTYYANNDYVVTVYDGELTLLEDSDGIRFYSDSAGVFTEFGVEKYPDLLGIQISQNSGMSGYNKCYAVIDSVYKQVTNGLIWRATSNYNIVVNK